MHVFADNPNYIVNGPNNANFPAAINLGWVPLAGISSIGWHIIAPSGTGTYIFEATNDDNPGRPVGDIVLTPQTIVLPAALATLAAPAAVAVNTIFGFGISESTNKAAMPEAKWMRVRYAFSAGGAATGVFIGVCRRGL